ncbi:hypothetical protein [Mycolicibacterium sp. XJ1904]
MCLNLTGYVTASGAINTSTVTQARHEGEVEEMARDFIACVLDVPVEEVQVKRRP